MASFDTQCCTVALPDFEPFIQSCYLQLMLMLLYDSLHVNLIVSRVKLWTVVGPRLRGKEIKSFALQQLDCVECNMHRCTVLLKDKIVANDTVI